mmetsp:Transcript_40478/g.101671  ORF Transcript_40478/g.101671 Transcript_40478/m.101671 type:complete len:294 (+) Transcript_40478:631-1512(+)
MKAEDALYDQHRLCRELHHIPRLFLDRPCLETELRKLHRLAAGECRKILPDLVQTQCIGDLEVELALGIPRVCWICSGFVVHIALQWSCVDAACLDMKGQAGTECGFAAGRRASNNNNTSTILCCRGDLCTHLCKAVLMQCLSSKSYFGLPICDRCLIALGSTMVQWARRPQTPQAPHCKRGEVQRWAYKVELTRSCSCANFPRHTSKFAWSGDTGNSRCAKVPRASWPRDADRVKAYRISNGGHRAQKCTAITETVKFKEALCSLHWQHLQIYTGRPDQLIHRGCQITDNGR